MIELSYLNEKCFLSLNEDDKKYNMCLEMAQEDLEDELGKEFYSELLSQYENENFNTDNETLYEDYIKKFLAWRTYFHYLKFANTNATPSGIREFNDENSSVASDIKMYSLEKNIQKRAEDYKFKMLSFLKLEQEKDATKYPKFDYKCKEIMSFAITSVNKRSDALLRVNKTILTNE